MKKALSVILVLALAISLCACGESDYDKAMKAYEAGDYAKAREIFESLGDYKDSIEMAAKCKMKEIDQKLQGTWKYSLGELSATFTFNNGRVVAGIVGYDAIKNEGSYRIDLDDNGIYICYDYIISSSGKTPNTEEKLLFVFTYNAGTLKLENNDSSLKKHEVTKVK